MKRSTIERPQAWRRCSATFACAVSFLLGGGGAPVSGEETSPPATRAHGFLAGGISVVTSESLVNDWMLGGWNLSGGVEFPVRPSLALVPRVHHSRIRGEHAGTARWIRLSMDARFDRWKGSYQEVGLGFGLLDWPVTVSSDDGLTSHRLNRWFGTPHVQYVHGWHGDHALGPAFMAEASLVVGLGAQSPGGVEVLAGVTW